VPDAFRFDEETQRKARNYLHNGLAASLLKSIIILFLALVVLDLRLSIGLEKAIVVYATEPSLVVLLYALIGYAIFWLISIPFDYYRGFVLERKFELSNETLGMWLWDKTKMSILSLLVILALAEGIYSFMCLSPTYWWFLLWIVTAPVMAFFMYVSPVLIMPLFYKFPKLKNEELLGRLTKLADKAGIKIIGVFEMKAGEKTKKATAALTGMRNTRRMLLSDTFLANYSGDETESVMGHEIGHHIYGHIWKLDLMLTLILFAMLFITSQVLRATFGFFGFERVDTVATLPLFALIFGLLYVGFTPLMNTLSRRAEGHCDQYELELVEKPDAYISAMVKLCDQNLRYANPSALIEFLFYDHPSGKKRIERAVTYKRLKGL
jgi:STE24 endopeptidase